MFLRSISDVAGARRASVCARKTNFVEGERLGSSRRRRDLSHSTRSPTVAAAAVGTRIRAFGATPVRAPRTASPWTFGRSRAGTTTSWREGPVGERCASTSRDRAHRSGQLHHRGDSERPAGEPEGLMQWTAHMIRRPVVRRRGRRSQRSRARCRPSRRSPRSARSCREADRVTAAAHAAVSASPQMLRVSVPDPRLWSIAVGQLAYAISGPGATFGDQGDGEPGWSRERPAGDRGQRRQARARADGIRRCPE
jgi:hypothetical protein